MYITCCAHCAFMVTSNIPFLWHSTQRFFFLGSTDEREKKSNKTTIKCIMKPLSQKKHWNVTNDNECLSIMLKYEFKRYAMFTSSMSHSTNNILWLRWIAFLSNVQIIADGKNMKKRDFYFWILNNFIRWRCRFALGNSKFKGHQ